MAKQHVLVGRHIVQTVVVPSRRRHAAAVDRQHPLGDEEPVVAVGDKVDAHSRDHYPERVNLLAPVEGDVTEGAGAQQCQQPPSKMFP